MGKLKEKERKEEVDDQKNLLEWAVFWMSLLLVLSLLAYLGYQAYHKKPATPELAVEFWPEPTEAQPNRYHIVVHNTGGETAGTVLVELQLQQEGKEVEKGELEFMFVPQESKREGWVNFSQKPDSGNAVSARVVSYQKP